MEDMARDIKFNLKSQSDKLENKTLKNLYGINKEMSNSNRLITLIKKHRFKNKLVLWGIIALLVVSLMFIFWMTFVPASAEVEVVEAPHKSSPEPLDDQASEPIDNDTMQDGNPDAASP